MVWNGNEAVCVEQVPSSQQVKHTSPLGSRYNTAWSSSVQVFLAREEPEKARRLIADRTIILPSPAADFEDYLHRVKTVSSQGYATNYGETSPDEVGVAAPVLDHRGQLTACIMVAAPRFRVSSEQLQALAEACSSAAASHPQTRRPKRRVSTTGQPDDALRLVQNAEMTN